MTITGIILFVLGIMFVRVVLWAAIALTVLLLVLVIVSKDPFARKSRRTE